MHIDRLATHGLSRVPKNAVVAPEMAVAAAAVERLSVMTAVW